MALEYYNSIKSNKLLIFKTIIINVQCHNILLLYGITCRYIIFLWIEILFIASVKKKKKNLLVRINCQYNILIYNTYTPQVYVGTSRINKCGKGIMFF